MAALSRNLQHVPYVTLNNRSTAHASTVCSFYLLFGDLFRFVGPGAAKIDELGSRHEALATVALILGNDRHFTIALCLADRSIVKGKIKVVRSGNGKQREFFLSYLSW
jgi:hypothetical protein